jgi:hypothetical protein
MHNCLKSLRLKFRNLPMMVLDEVALWLVVDVDDTDDDEVTLWLVDVDDTDDDEVVLWLVVDADDRDDDELYELLDEEEDETALEELVELVVDVEEAARVVEDPVEEIELLLEVEGTVFVVVEALVESELLTDDVDEATVERAEVELETTAAAWYMFNRLRPPQYSSALAAQTMLQPSTLGTELVWFTEPALITLPQ